jgi:hypothetical protein
MEELKYDIKFINLIYTYDKKKIKKLVYSCDIYNDIDNLVKIDNFFCELYNDLIQFCGKWDIEKIVELFFTKNKYETRISYTRIFNTIFSLGHTYDDVYNYSKFIEIEDFELFKKIISKYSNIKLSDKSIPIDPSTKIIICDKNFNLSQTLMIKIINQINGYKNNKLEIINKLNQDKLEFLLINIEKNNTLLNKLLISDCYPNNINKILSELIIKTKIDFISDDITQKNFSFLLVKMLVENNIFDDFNEILDIVYSRSIVSFIEILSILRLDLLNINLNLLKKIIYYGRFEVFEKLYWYIPWKILSILKDNNPFDLTDCDFNYCDDINGGYHRGNDEYERRIIGKKKHKELFNMILSIGEEKKYSHVCWTDEIKLQWVEMAITNDTNRDYSQDSMYFTNYSELKELFGLNYDLKSKPSIKQHIELFGKSHTWELIKSTCDENILDLLFD